MEFEKIIKSVLKTVSKEYSIDYSELKSLCKKSLKKSKEADDMLMSSIEEIWELQNVESEVDLDEYTDTSLMMFLKMKGVTDVPEEEIRSAVWELLEEEWEEGSDEESGSEDSDESDFDDSEDSEQDEPELAEIVIPKKVKVASATPKTPKKVKIVEPIPETVFETEKLD